MTNFNFLSGSSIDNTTKLLYDILSSGRCYLGFARGEVNDISPVPNVQWGVNSLVYIEFPAVTGSKNITTVMVTGAGDAASGTKFHDISSLRTLGLSGSPSLQIVKIYKAPVTATNIGQCTQVLDTATMRSNYVSTNWMMIEGIPRDYFTTVSASAGYEYIIVNSNNDWTNRARILKKSFVNVPFYVTDCELWTKSPSAEMIANNLQKISNIIGESYVVGLTDPLNAPGKLQNPSVDAVANKTYLEAATFQLRSKSGEILIDDMTMMDPDGSARQIYFEVLDPEGDLGNSTRHLAFQYQYTQGEFQTIKVIVGNRQVDELAIWNEKQPYDSVIPNCDASPPGIEVSFLKNPVLVGSIFDVKGLVNIPASSITYIKEMTSNAVSAEYSGYGFEIESIELSGEPIVHTGSVSGVGPDLKTIYLEPYHTFVTGDVVKFEGISQSYSVTAVDYHSASGSITLTTVLPYSIPKATGVYSLPNEVVAKIAIAKTTDKRKALRYGFNSAMVDIKVFLTNDASGNAWTGSASAANPTDEIYRQLFIAYEAKDASGNELTLPTYKTNPSWSNDLLFNRSTWEWDMGTIMYLSNKIPIYRKYAKSSTGKEEFKIIL